jgi:hypothetical protein
VGCREEDLVVDVELEVPVVAIVVAGLRGLGTKEMLGGGGDGVGELAHIHVERNAWGAQGEVAGQRGMIAVGQVEWGVACASVGGIVVGDLDGGEVSVPVGLVVVDVGAEKGTEAAVDPFGLAVGLGVESRGEPEGRTQLAEDGLPKVAEESRVPVRDD